MNKLDLKEKCSLCNGTKKIIEYPNGEIRPYLPALVSDAYHRKIKVKECHQCKT